jgi:hypothetical protein
VIALSPQQGRHVMFDLVSTELRRFSHQARRNIMRTSRNSKALNIGLHVLNHPEIHLKAAVRVFKRWRISQASLASFGSRNMAHMNLKFPRPQSGRSRYAINARNQNCDVIVVNHAAVVSKKGRELHAAIR